MKTYKPRRYRIIQKRDNRYYPQYKWLWFWCSIKNVIHGWDSTSREAASYEQLTKAEARVHGEANKHKRFWDAVREYESKPKVRVIKDMGRLP